jgi:asparagine synthase (glutamine-hydrolysing)
MRDFVALRWNIAHLEAASAAARARALLTPPHPEWAILIDQPGWLVAERLESGMVGRVLAYGQGALCGDVFDRGSARLGQGAAALIEADARDIGTFSDMLMRECWGAYVALWIDPADADSLHILRDPMGMQPCASWRSNGVRLVTSDPSMWVLCLPPEELAIDWGQIAGLLSFPGNADMAAPLRGVDAPEAGALTCYQGSGWRVQRLWRPVDFCRKRAQTPDPHAIRRLVDGCVAAWLSVYGDAIAEISGGFDSSIIAASAMRRGHGLLAGFHFHTDDIPGDERRYARLLAAHIGLDLEERPVAVQSLGLDRLGDMPIGLKPGIGSTSLFHDSLLAKCAEERGAGTLLTGQGGDALFFQHPAGEIAADPGAWRSFVSLGLWTGETVWNLAGHALRGRWGAAQREPLASKTGLFVRPEAIDRLPSPWMDGTETLSPAKHMQVRALASARRVFGSSYCGRGMTVLHPLLSQPLVEQGLGISVLDLTQGRRDRALARTAFAERLPAALIERRGKGTLTAFFGRTLAASTPFLKEYLLDGALAAHGVIDLQALEAVLDPDRLMQSECYGSLLATIITEQWARTWQERLADAYHCKRADPGAPCPPRQASSQANMRPYISSALARLPIA